MRTFTEIPSVAEFISIPCSSWNEAQTCGSGCSQLYCKRYHDNIECQVKKCRVIIIKGSLPYHKLYGSDLSYEAILLEIASWSQCSSSAYRVTKNWVSHSMFHDTYFNMHSILSILSMMTGWPGDKPITMIAIEIFVVDSQAYDNEFADVTSRCLVCTKTYRRLV